MCTGIALPIDELPEELVRRHRHRLVMRTPGDSHELRFLYRDPRPELPAWYGSQLSIYQWGNRIDCVSGDPRIYGRVYLGAFGLGAYYGDIAN